MSTPRSHPRRSAPLAELARVAVALTALAVPGSALAQARLTASAGMLRAQPDLSRLPEVEDSEPSVTTPEPAPAETPREPSPLGPPAADPLAGRLYLGAPPAEPIVDFVPAGPSGVQNPRRLWDAMLRAPPPPVETVAIRRLRVASFLCFGGSGAALITTLATLGQQDPSPALRGAGYGALGVSALSAAAGGVLLYLSHRRQRAYNGDL